MIKTINMPRLSLNEDTCLLSEWKVKLGDDVKEGDVLFTIETDKSTMDVPSAHSGKVLRLYYEDGDIVQVLTPVCAIGEAGETAPELEPAGGDNSAQEGPTPSQGPKGSEAKPPEPPRPPVLAQQSFLTPRARKTAQANGITDISAISASGAESRILEEDVIAYMAEPSKSAPEYEVKKPSKIRSVISRNMMRSMSTTAQTTCTAVFDASALMSRREKYKLLEETKGITIGDMINYALSRTLAELTYMNCLMQGEDELLEYKTVNLGVAVDTDRGLMVPTLKNAESKSVGMLSEELKMLAGQCREGGIDPQRLTGGTFTVSNLGALGIRTFTPILNAPQIGILGVGCIDYMVKKTGFGMLCYPACTLSLTYDHRAVDGAPAARFLKRLRENLENIDELVEVRK